MKYRIRKRDSRNWAIEIYNQSGVPISRGRHVGKLTKGGWDEINPIGYYSAIRHAAQKMLDVQIAENLSVDDDNTPTNFIAAIDAAVKKVDEIVSAALAENVSA